MASTPEPTAPCPQELFALPVVALARRLIGCVLWSRSEQGSFCAGRIVETEAYRGPQDLAAHSARGRRTKRTEAMFGPPGHAYMFMLYGTSWAFNVVAGAEDHPHAVLVRALEPLVGVELMAARRGLSPRRRELTNGPGKLCAALDLSGRHYGQSLRSDSLFISDGPRSPLGTSARINIDYAGPWALKRWRFFERGNRYVSVRPRE